MFNICRKREREFLVQSSAGTENRPHVYLAEIINRR